MVRASLAKRAEEEQKNLKELYKNLLKSGWTLSEIDEMDIHYYFELHKPEKVYIDDIKLL